MAVKILMLKSLEDVIADVVEVSNGLEIIKYKLNDPYTLVIDQKADSSNTDYQTRIGFYPYAPLSKNSTIELRPDWVVSIVDPIEEIETSYMEKVNGKVKSSDI